jgi:hypothetical protein
MCVEGKFLDRKNMKTLSVIEISRINTDHGFRYALNEPRIVQLAALREAGVKLDPIKVIRRANGRYDLISGNHRRHVALQRGETTMEALVYDAMSTLEAVKMGLQENAGPNGANPLPPTEDDLRMIIRELLQADQTPATIVATLPFPSSYVRKLMTNVQAGELKRKKSDALSYMATNGCTVKQAAEKVRIPVESLVDHLSRKGQKGKNKLNYDTNNPHKNEMAKLGNRARGFSRAFNDIAKTAIKDVDENGRSVDTVIKVVNHAEELLHNAMLMVENVRARVSKFQYR